jgi:heme-degrading monooxygenase HmoA
MPIMREWRAEIRRVLKDEYIAYVNSTGMVEYGQTPGNLGAAIATRDIDSERTEIVTLSWWKDEDSIKAFAGSDISKAHYYPEDDRFLLTRPETVQHYDSGAHAAAFSALVPASHRLDVWLGGAAVSDDSFPLTDGGELPADR